MQITGIPAMVLNLVRYVKDVRKSINLSIISSTVTVLVELPAYFRLASLFNPFFAILRVPSKVSSEHVLTYGKGIVVILSSLPSSSCTLIAL